MSRWVGLFELGLGMKQSLSWPWLFLLLEVLISKGRASDSISLQMFVKDSLKGPPASIEPSPKNSVLHDFESVEFYLKFEKSLLELLTC